MNPTHSYRPMVCNDLRKRAMEWELYGSNIYSDVLPLPDPEKQLQKLKDEIPTLPLFRYTSRYVNPGEHLSAQGPLISRAYFKMKEILCRYFNPDKKVNALLLCESPGGFTQACSEYFKKLSWMALTLPGDIEWKSDPKRIIFRDIIKDDLPSDVKYTIVTGDGGFEADPKRQEEQNYPLFEAQMLKGYEALEIGGCLIVKCFDMFHSQTKALIIELSRRFDKAFILKPWGSRICNSERYFIGLQKRLTPKTDMVSLDRLAQINQDFARVQIAGLQEAIRLSRVPGITREMLEKPVERHLMVSRRFNQILENVQRTLTSPDYYAKHHDHKQ